MSQPPHLHSDASLALFDTVPTEKLRGDARINPVYGYKSPNTSPPRPSLSDSRNAENWVPNPSNSVPSVPTDSNMDGHWVITKRFFG